MVRAILPSSISTKLGQHPPTALAAALGTLNSLSFLFSSDYFNATDGIRTEEEAVVALTADQGILT